MGRKWRVTKFFNEQDNLDPFDVWPKWAQEHALTVDKSNDARYKLFQFLWRNGLDPETCAGWTRLTDCIRGKIVYNMEEKVIKHSLQMLHQATTDNGVGPLSKGRVYDLRQRRPL